MSDIVAMIAPETKLFIYKSLIDGLRSNQGAQMGLLKDQGHPDYKSNALGEVAIFNEHFEEKDTVYIFLQKLASDIKESDIFTDELEFFANFQEYSRFVYSNSANPDRSLFK